MDSNKIVSLGRGNIRLWRTRQGICSSNAKFHFDGAFQESFEVVPSTFPNFFVKPHRLYSPELYFKCRVMKSRLVSIAHLLSYQSTSALVSCSTGDVLRINLSRVGLEAAYHLQVVYVSNLNVVNFRIFEGVCAA